jgi:multidrug efflux pump
VTVIALVLSWIVSVYFVPYLGTLLLKVPPHVGGRPHAVAGQSAAACGGKGITDDPHEVFDSPFYTPSGAWCIGAWSTAG